MQRKKVLYGWGNEELWAKTKWFLTLTPFQRYMNMVSMQDLFFIANPSKKKRHGNRRSFKTIQVLG